MNSLIFTISTALTLVLVVAAVVFQVLEMHSYGMLPS